MAYIGQSVQIPLGQFGLMTDEISTQMPPSALKEAFNIRFKSNRIEKEAGSVKMNPAQLISGILGQKTVAEINALSPSVGDRYSVTTSGTITQYTVGTGDDIIVTAGQTIEWSGTAWSVVAPSEVRGIFDWWPTSSLQRTIAVTADGKVWRSTDAVNFSQIGTMTGLGSNLCTMVQGGSEVSGQNRKLFLFPGSQNPVYIDGDATSLSNVTAAADWSGSNFPTFGIIHKGRLVTMGCPSNPHTIYMSNFDSHNTFTTNVVVLDIFPGDGLALYAATNYKGRLFLFKNPVGVYMLVDDGGDSTATNWYAVKISDSFGIASKQSLCPTVDDMLMANSTGSITSLVATNSFGDVEAADILANAKIEDYIRTNYNVGANSSLSSIYYPEKKVAMFTYRTQGLNYTDSILCCDVSKQQPRFYINNKDAATVLGLRKDSNGILRPFYGDRNGYLWKMDQSNYINDTATAYNGSFRTQSTDFSYADPTLGIKLKFFEFITVVYEELTLGNLSIDIYIDEVLTQTVSVDQSFGSVYDTAVYDTDVYFAPQIRQRRIPIKGSGYKIAFGVKNNNISEGFKIERLIVDFRIGGEVNRE